MRIRCLYYYFLVSLFLVKSTDAQSLRQTAETPSFTDYVIENNDLRILPAHTLLIPVIAGIPRYEILELSLATIPDTLTYEKKAALQLAGDSVSVVQLMEPGYFRGTEVAPTALHLALVGNNELKITRRLKIRVYKDSEPVQQRGKSKLKPQSSPLATGQWFKIPIDKDGIYQIDTGYLNELGLNTSSINPKNIQIWGTGGTVLPEANAAPKPEFSEIPILVEGEEDGRFDQGDRIVFYANGPDNAYFDTDKGDFINEIHPYSAVNFIFLTLAETEGKRLSSVNKTINPQQTKTTFKDFIWKEEELVKAEASLRSGREWLGQTIGSVQSGNYVSVLKDTLPGIVPNSTVKVSGMLYGRSLSTLTHNIRLNGTSVATVSTLSISDFNNSEGFTARSASFSREVTPEITDGILNLEIRTTYRGNNDQVFVDWLRLIVERELSLKGRNLFFNTEPDAGGEVETAFMLKGFATVPTVMDVTNPIKPKLLETNKTGNDYQMNYFDGVNARVVAQADFYTPELGTAVENQNLRALSLYPDYLVVTSKVLENRAQELAAYRNSQGLTPWVVTQEQIFNEFSGGLKDPTAIRNFIKYIWDASIDNGERQLDYLLLFGDTTYDPKGIAGGPMINHVLTYESKESISREGTYGTDDYFGYLDDDEGDFGNGTTSNSFLMDIGIGRIPVQTTAEAGDFIQKIKNYEDPKNSGPWQSQFTFAADDDNPTLSDKDLHVYNADVSAELMNVDEPGIRIKKIYEFSYPSEITGSGLRIPEATKDFMNSINQGTLALSYLGHGNEQVLSDENIFRSDYIPEFTNIDRLTTLITATCQFGRYDDTGAQSGAEKFVLADNGGGIAAFTTTRVVYTSAFAGSNSNFALSIAISQRLTERNPDGSSKRMGDIAMQTKNSVIDGTSQRIGASLNNKKFILLGDPATIFKLPSKNVRVSAINNNDVTQITTPMTIRALDTIELKGEILDGAGQVDTEFNGETTLTIYDARRPVSLPDRPWIDNPASDCRLTDCSYLVESDMLFKGKASVSNGTFTLPVIIPKDISSSASTGRILMFSDSGSYTAGGAFTQINFNGTNPDAVNDGTGPKIDLYLNDKSFVNGALLNNSPTLFVELEDESGINTSGTGVGHEIIATIDTKPRQTIILNEYFEGNLNSFTGGRIEYPLDQLPEGSYTLKVRAWDVHNNPSESEIYFEVANQEELTVRNIFNYPNPMNNKTAFTFEHNQPGNPLEVSVKIYTLNGRPVQQLQESIITTSSYASIPWNGRDRDNDRLGNGTYIYVLRVTADTPKGRHSTEKIEKLVIIR